MGKLNMGGGKPAPKKTPKKTAKKDAE